MKFGQAASDYTPADNSGEIWIRGFKDPATQIRIAPAQMQNEADKTVYGTAAWPTEREHYEPSIGAFPCAERFGVQCVGCEDPSEAVQTRNRKYYVNALDEKGALRVYKLGVNLYKTFKAREQRAIANDPDNKQPLSDRDYIINKMGKGLETSYDPEPGDRYKVDFPELHDIQQILSDRYDAAVAAYTGAEPDTSNEQAKPEEPKNDSRLTEFSDKADPRDAANGNGSKNGHTGWGKNPSEELIDSSDTEVIKGWLDDIGVEYPERIPRARLVTLAKKTAAKAPY